MNYFDFSYGAEFFLLGKKAKLVISYGRKNVVFSETEKHGDEQTFITVVISERSRKQIAKAEDLASHIKKQLESYFKGIAQDYILPRMAELSEFVSLTPEQVKIRQYRARWGSCNSRKEVSFNYLLMMAPMWVVDYVIVHELCHLKHLNHSKAFWQLVAQHYPDYQDAKHWLNIHQNELVWNLPS